MDKLSLFPEKLGDSDSAPWKFEERLGGNANLIRHICFTDYNIGMHTHEEYYELNMIIAGSGCHYYEDKRIYVTEGDFFIVPPKYRHGYMNERNLTVYHILIHRNFFTHYEAALKMLPGYYSLFEISPTLRSRSKHSKLLHLKGEDYKRIFDIIENTALTAIKPELSVYEAIEISARTLILISALSELWAKETDLGDYSNQMYESEFSSIVEYIHTKITNGENVTISELSSEFLISKSSLDRLFIRFTGGSPKQYISSLRIERVKTVLAMTDMKLVTIANECGYADQSHMNHDFFSSTGMTPSEYRRRMQK